MAELRITDQQSFINDQSKVKESIRQYLMQAEAIAELVMCDGFLERTPTTIHSSLWVLHDLIVAAKQCNDQLMNF